MAFTRKMLKAMGIDEDKIEQIIDAHLEVIEPLKSERDDLRSTADELRDAKKQLADLQADGGDWKSKYEAEHTAFEDFKTQQTKAAETRAKDGLYRQMLKDQNVSEKRIDAIMKLTDLDAVKLTADGKLDDADALASQIKETWADFIVSANTQGADTQTPPGENVQSIPVEMPVIF